MVVHARTGFPNNHKSLAMLLSDNNLLLLPEIHEPRQGWVVAGLGISRVRQETEGTL